MSDKDLESEQLGEIEQTKSWQHLPAIKFHWQLHPWRTWWRMSLLNSARLWGKMMKSCTTLSLLSQCMMQNIHQWSKAMKLSDTATSDYSTHTKLGAFIPHSFSTFWRQTKLMRLWKANHQKSCAGLSVLFCFCFVFFPLFLSVTGKSQRSTSNPYHFIVPPLFCLCELNNNKKRGICQCQDAT